MVKKARTVAVRSTRTERPNRKAGGDQRYAHERKPDENVAGGCARVHQRVIHLGGCFVNGPDFTTAFVRRFARSCSEGLAWWEREIQRRKSDGFNQRWG